MSMPLPPTISVDIQLPHATTSSSDSSLCICSSGHNPLNFKDIMSEASAATDIISQLKQILTEEQLADLKNILQSGNELPLSANFSLYTDQIAELVEEIEQLGQILAQIPNQLQEAAKQEGQLSSSLIETAKKLSNGIGKLGNDLPRGFENLGQQLKEIMSPVTEQSSTALNQAKDIFSSVKTDLPILEFNIKNPVATQAVTEPSTQNLSNISSTLSGIAQFNNVQQSSGLTLPASITTPLNDKGFGDSMGDRIMWMVGKGMQAASIRINPPNLGPIHVQLSVQNDQANVNFIAQHGVVKEALEAAIPRLREMMAESNMQLVNVDVSQRETASHNSRSEQAEYGSEQQHSGQQSEDELLVPDSEDLVVQYVSTRLLDDYA